MSDEMREAYVAIGSDICREKDFARIWQAATASTDAEWRALCERLVVALKFYGNGENWEWNTKPTQDPHILDCGCEVQRDFGAVAREALAEAKLRGVGV